MWNLYALKYKEEYYFYHNFEWKKAVYILYMQRIVQQWWNKENAINPDKWSKRKIDEIWRECSKCWIYKVRDLFNKTINWRTSQCKICRAETKRKYRQTVHWQMIWKNLRVKKRADPKYREKEKIRYSVRQKENRKKLSEYSKQWRNENKEKVKDRRKYLDLYYYSPGKKVYFWSIIGKIKKVEKWKWCLVKLENWMIMWISKNRLKPFKLKSEESSRKYLY